MSDPKSPEMALGQLRLAIGAAQYDMHRRGIPPSEKEAAEWYAAIDAHIAAMGEPVAWMNRDDLHDLRCGAPRKPVFGRPRLDINVPLFLSTPLSGDWDAVRYVAARMRFKGEYGLDARAAVLVEWADKLTAALPKSPCKPV